MTEVEELRALLAEARLWVGHNLDCSTVVCDECALSCRIDAALASEKTKAPFRTKVIGNLKWQEEIDSRSFTWQEAKDYAASLGDGWRLPTIAELLTLVNFTRVRPACSVFADCPSAFFWSSSPGIDRPNAAWGVGFSYGYTSSYDVGNDYRVRLVRSVS